MQSLFLISDRIRLAQDVHREQQHSVPAPALGGRPRCRFGGIALQPRNLLESGLLPRLRRRDRLVGYRRRQSFIPARLERLFTEYNSSTSHSGLPSRPRPGSSGHSWTRTSSTSSLRCTGTSRCVSVQSDLLFVTLTQLPSNPIRNPSISPSSPLPPSPSSTLVSPSNSLLGRSSRPISSHLYSHFPPPESPHHPRPDSRSCESRSCPRYPPAKAQQAHSVLGQGALRTGDALCLLCRSHPRLWPTLPRCHHLPKLVRLLASANRPSLAEISRCTDSSHPSSLLISCD